MKNQVLIISFLLMSSFIKAQCPSCEIDFSCGEGATYPTLCPEVMPNATAGEYYEQAITFFLPTEVAQGDIVATLLEVEVISSNGIPFGLELTINDDDNTFFPSEGENYGCATVCGIPVLPGDYEVLINAQARVEVLGFETEFVQGFVTPITVEPGETSNASFILDGTAACGELAVDAESILELETDLIQYNWDFGNGQTSTEADPSAQSYTDAGDYTIGLETTVFQLELDEINLTSISSNGDGDADELFGVLSPDPYFIVTDDGGNTVFSSSAVVDVESASFTDLGIVLNENSSFYTVEFFDEDTFTDDDPLGEFTITNLQQGSVPFSSDGSTGNYTINLEVTAQLYDEEVVSVFPVPEGQLSFNEETNSLLINGAAGNSFTWFLNDALISGESDSLLVLGEPGVYFCELTNEFGCSFTTETFTLCPEVSIVFSNGELSTTGDLTSYTWFYNGLEIMGENGSTIPSQGDGNYAVEITTDYGCEVESEVLTLINSSVEYYFDENELKIWPNPASDILQISLPKHWTDQNILIQDIHGKVVHSGMVSYSNSPTVLDLSNLESGSYILTAEGFPQLRKKFLVLK